MSKLKTVLISFLLVFLAGCTCSARYRPYLQQLRENLSEDVRPKYQVALEKSGASELIIAVDVGLVDDMIKSLDRVIASGEPE